MRYVIKNFRCQAITLRNVCSYSCLFVLAILSALVIATTVAGPRTIAQTQQQSPLGIALRLDEATREDDDSQLSFNKDIRPILLDTCFACHGPDSAAREAELRIDDREAAIAAEVWIPGDPDSSLGIERIFAENPDMLMPPGDSHKQLSHEQKLLLYRWVKQGAEYEPHWAFSAPQQPDVPSFDDPRATAWIQNPIDAFVLNGLQDQGLSPAPEADRYTLARRVALDITGLPPTPEVVEQFVRDTSDNAYERYVDRLLGSQRWGEHRGRYWLDAARYADTHGIHFDNYREMWSYRDWVINAFNKNQPFDQFTIESLAGDLLAQPTRDQLIATGFNRCNITTNEGGIIDEEYLVLYTRDRTETVSKVWMGLTANCAVCHDHKFDPLSQREFYAMSAFFNNTVQGARDQNIKDTPPVIRVPRLQDQQRWDQLALEIESIDERSTRRTKEAEPEFETWLAAADSDPFSQYLPDKDLEFFARLTEASGESARVEVRGDLRTIQWGGKPEWQDGPIGSQAIQPQGALLAMGDVGNFDWRQPFSMAVWVKPSANDSSGAVCARMDNGKKYRGWDLWMQQRRFGMHLVHSWPSNALKVVSREQVPAGKWTHVTVTYDGSGRAAGVKVYFDGIPQATNFEKDSLSKSTLTAVPFKLGQRDQGEALSAVALSDLRIYTKTLEDSDAQTLAQISAFRAWLEQPIEQLTDVQKEQLYQWWLVTLDQPYRSLIALRRSLKNEFEQLKRHGTVAHVMQERDASAKAFVLYRGEYDQRREEVTPDTPAMLPAFPDDLPRNRLGFAKWLLSPAHPLTSRVIVNQFWQQVFGQGIVPTTGDFGLAGSLPTHPRLLDWLAVDFRENGWDVKRFFKQVFMSSTYRQSAQVTAKKIEADPDNRWLSRGPRFRMDAEMVRDYALAACGTLSPTIGGPSVKPYQPSGVWEAVAMLESNTHDYVQDHGEALYRRSMYTFWKRSAPPASMETFNAPSREFCIVDRERTNTPLQALVTLNDPQFIEAARRLAEEIVRSLELKRDASREKAVDEIARRVLCRQLSSTERNLLLSALEDYKSFYEQNIEEAHKLIAVGELEVDSTLEPSQLASLTMLINTVLNMDEVLNK